MIRIDRLSFGFVVTDEQFAQGLYADWDSFCRTCVEKVMEECLSVYDKKKVLYEIEQLGLNLGSIPEEDFYWEFPRKLREELQRALPLLNISAGSREESTDVSRLENLLFYLEHGYPKVEWSDKEFNLTEELEWIATQSATCIHKISKLCLSKEHILRRLLCQADNETVLLRIYAAALTEPAATLYEKRRFMVILLDARPDILVRFVHKPESDTGLREMAELLDTVSVRLILEIEAREHTEIDLPPYWHYLYEWLIRYYPFNGLAIFGSKNDFIHHLHYRLLTFIHKQTYSFYFSKEELTVGFLLEIFGPAYYIEVINAIYNLQPRHADGSPVHDSYFNGELYRILLNLSLLQCMTRVDFYQASVLEQTMEWMHNKINDYPFLTAKGVVFSTALSQALLLYMQDAERAGGSTLTEKEIVDKYLSYLHLVFTGKSNYQDHAEWTDLSDKITSTMKWTGWQDIQKKEVAYLLSNKEIGNTVFGHYIISIMEKEPERLLAWLEKNTATDTSPLIRIAEISDVTLLIQWIAFLPTVAGFEHPNAFRQLTARLIHLVTDRTSVSDMISVLLLWIRETDWRKQTPEQMEGYFFSRLSVKNNTELLPVKALTDNTLPKNTQEKLLHWYIRFQTKEADLQQALATYLIGHTEKWIYNSEEETVQSLPILQEKTEVERKEIEHIVKQILIIMEITNAGLCLFTPWFERLFFMLDYLGEGRKTFKNTESQIRAVFLLQYLNCQEEKAYEETELVFNRLLVDLPMHIPLPKQLELTNQEKEIAENLLEGVKSNWNKMRNTSMGGFLQSFITRKGQLEQQEEEWVLTVENRAYDILLDSLPWSFNHIHNPWLKKYIRVNWSWR